MSHFVVMVVGEDIEDILEPYNEGMEVMNIWIGRKSRFIKSSWIFRDH